MEKELIDTDGKIKIRDYWYSLIDIAPSLTESKRVELEWLIRSLIQAERENRDAHFTGKPIQHDIPCEDCGDENFVDWHVPHLVFNSVCPGGNGYLCLPCFGTRMKKLNPLIQELREAGYVDDNPFDIKEYSKAITQTAITQERERLVAEVEEMKTEEGHSLAESLAYNQALADVISIINPPIEEIPGFEGTMGELDKIAKNAASKKHKV